jgi:hypothetical protein
MVANRMQETRSPIDDPFAHDDTSAPLLSRWAWWGLSVVALLCAGGLWWGQTHTFRLITHVPLTVTGRDAVFLNTYQTTGGVILREGEFSFSFRDWETGRERWRLNCAAPNLSTVRELRPTGRSVLPDAHPIPAYSPSGRFFAAAVVDGDRWLVESWDRGRLLGSPRLPLPLTRCALTVLDDGRILCWTEGPGDTPLVMLQDGQERARGRIALAPDEKGVLAPDGSLFCVSSSRGFTAYHLATQGTKLRLTKRQTAPEALATAPVHTDGHWSASVLAQGYIASMTGSVYAPTRTRLAHAAPGWIFWSADCAGRAICQRHATATGPQLRVWALASGAVWSVSPQAEVYNCEVSSDGRYLLALIDPAQTRSRPRRRVKLETIWPQNPTLYYALYERPGRLRVRLPIQQTLQDGTVTVGGQRIVPRAWSLAPRTRRIALVGQQWKQEQFECLMLGW